MDITGGFPFHLGTIPFPVTLRWRALLDPEPPVPLNQQKLAQTQGQILTQTQIRPRRLHNLVKCSAKCSARCSAKKGKLFSLLITVHQQNQQNLHPCWSSGQAASTSLHKPHLGVDVFDSSVVGWHGLAGGVGRRLLCWPRSQCLYAVNPSPPLATSCASSVCSSVKRPPSCWT